MTDLRPFERYRGLVDDWPAFCDAVRSPLPPCIWTNTLRTTPAALAARLAAGGVDASPVPWHDGAFTLAPGASPGTRLEYLAGLYHVQEAAALLPVRLLDPQPGERVLDLCAAPGNKTAQIAVAMRNRGIVVANDRSAERSRAIPAILDRLGVACACVATSDAAGFPSASGTFDRVLADVPCSCEGTVRKNPDLGPLSPERRDRLARLQQAILTKAVQRCRPGGRVVYATCTLAPEENELVVDAVLRAAGPALRLLPARLAGLAASEGVTAWEGRALDPSLRLALRVWPHQNDTGGFFVAVLEKSGDGVPAAQETPAWPGDVPDSEAWFRRFTDHFGLPPEHFAGGRLAHVARRYLSFVAPGAEPPERPVAETLGLPFVRIDGRYPKPTTAAALAFGPAATRHVVEVTREQAEAYHARTPFRVAAGQAVACRGTGYVVVRVDGLPLGIALFRPDGDGGGTVESQFPRDWQVGAITREA